MVGFFLVINPDEIDFNLPIINKDDKLVFNYTKHKNFYLGRNCNSKFLNDKLFYEDDKYLVVTDGVIFNSKDIICKYGGKNLVESMICMYNDKGNEFCNSFRGSFSGILYDKVKNKWLIFTDHVGDKKIFYSKYKKIIVISSKIINIVNFYKKNKIPYSFDKNGAYCLLTQGFMIQDYTLIKEVKKLLPGSYIKLHNDKFEVKMYHKYSNTQNYKQSENEIIENIDKLFKNAVKRQFDKDDEYGYKHIASLSGGLDSRMTTWVANTLGYNNILNYCFSQSNYYDEKISKHIATDLNNEYIFKTLDDAKFLFYLDDAVKINSGISIY
ncbi:MULTISPECIES: hypothetical protein [Clostridium]|uniref:asparagine synthase (glutamine-hydrolyzing) n=1 Tax=Clostridium lapidicellarium TaxID=3240931 RepID=A0ABV4DZL7_9CLOT